MKIVLTTRQAKLLKQTIEEETLRLMAMDDKGYTDANGNTWHTLNVDRIEKLDRIWDKLDKAIEMEEEK